jgi:hypothetical protein
MRLHSYFMRRIYRLIPAEFSPIQIESYLSLDPYRSHLPGMSAVAVRGRSKFGTPRSAE